jgi:hypothetical protein
MQEKTRLFSFEKELRVNVMAKIKQFCLDEDSRLSTDFTYKQYAYI